jgi:hypothetical protein
VPFPTATPEADSNNMDANMIGGNLRSIRTLRITPQEAGASRAGATRRTSIVFRKYIPIREVVIAATQTGLLVGLLC